MLSRGPAAGSATGRSHTWAKSSRGDEQRDRQQTARARLTAAGSDTAVSGLGDATPASQTRARASPRIDFAANRRHRQQVLAGQHVVDRELALLIDRNGDDGAPGTPQRGSQGRARRRRSRYAAAPGGRCRRPSRRGWSARPRRRRRSSPSGTRTGDRGTRRRQSSRTSAPTRGWEPSGSTRSMPDSASRSASPPP